MNKQLTKGAFPDAAASPWFSFGRPERALLGIWLALRILTLFWAAMTSSLRPRTEREQAIALWPPSTPIGSWFERVLLAPWERWDVEYFLRIVQHRYSTSDGTAQFHPLLPWLAMPTAWLSGQPLLGLMLVSSLASALLLLAFERLARLDLNAEAARASTLLLLFFPSTYVIFAPYTEGLWLLCAVLCFLCARHGKWWLAGVAGAFATLTRQQGLFLALPLAWELWEASGRDWKKAVAGWRNWLALALIPFGFLVWIVYRALALSDLNVSFNNFQGLIYSLLISPSATKVVPVQAFIWPWEALWRALTILRDKPTLDTFIDLSLGAVFVIVIVLAWRGMRISYRIFVAVIALLSFSLYTGPFYPYMGLPRHLLLCFPVFIGLANINVGRYRSLLLAAGILGSMFLLYFHTLHMWIP